MTFEQNIFIQEVKNYTVTADFDKRKDMLLFVREDLHAIFIKFLMLGLGIEKAYEMTGSVYDIHKQYKISYDNVFTLVAKAVSGKK